MRFASGVSGSSTRRVKKARTARREKAACDSEKSEARTSAPTAAGDFEKETHYVDGSGRKRKRKVIRTRALDSGVITKNLSRKWTDTERELVVAQHTKMAQVTHKPSWGSVAGELQKLHPTIFGRGSPGKPEGILRQDVRSIVERHRKRQITDGRGRPTALPEFVVVIMMAAMTSIVHARCSIISAPLLQPVAIGAIIASGCASVLNAERREHREGKKLRGLFCCSIQYIKNVIKDKGWRNVKPQADTRKLPANWEELRWLLVLRLAYYTFVHEVTHPSPLIACPHLPLPLPLYLVLVLASSPSPPPSPSLLRSPERW